MYVLKVSERAGCRFRWDAIRWAGRADNRAGGKNEKSLVYIYR